MQAFFESFTTWVMLILQLLVIAAAVLGMAWVGWSLIGTWFA